MAKRLPLALQAAAPPLVPLGNMTMEGAALVLQENIQAQAMCLVQTAMQAKYQLMHLRLSAQVA